MVPWLVKKVAETEEKALNDSGDPGAGLWTVKGPAPQARTGNIAAARPVFPDLYLSLPRTV
jgi:hypothetical protein